MIHAAILYLAMQVAANSAAQHEQAGQAALSAGQRDLAVKEFKEAAELDPKNAQVSFELGVAYTQTGEYGSAILPLKKALELDPGLTAANQPLGYALLAQGYSTEAVPKFAAANDRAGMGIAQLESGHLADAVENLQAAVAARPNDPNLLYYLARASGLFSKQLYDLVISSYPGSPRANQALGENYAALRQVPQAVECYQSALRERPDLPGAHLALGKIYADASMWKQAEDAFRTAAKLQPGSAEAVYRLGSALLQEGNAHEALQALERSNRLQPDMPETLYALGKAESMEGDDPAAERSWNRVIELEGTGDLVSQSHFSLAAIYRKEGKAADAAREMKAFEKSKREKE